MSVGKKTLKLDLSAPKEREILESYIRSLKGKTGVSFTEFLASEYPQLQSKDLNILITGGAQHWTIGGDDTSEENHNIQINGGDFTGCSFFDTSITGDVQDVSFRDCRFNRVAVEGCTFNKIDLRGANVEALEMQSFFPDQSSEVQISAHDPEISLKKIWEGFVDQGKSLAEYEEELETRLRKALKAEKDKASTKEEKAFFQQLIGDRNILQKIYDAVDTNPRINAVISEMQQLKSEINERNRRFFEGIAVKDATYFRGMKKEDAKKGIVTIKATRKDLERYIRQGKKGSFSEFIIRQSQVTPDKNKRMEVPPIC